MDESAQRLPHHYPLLLLLLLLHSSKNEKTNKCCTNELKYLAAVVVVDDVIVAVQTKLSMLFSRNIHPKCPHISSTVGAFFKGLGAIYIKIFATLL